MTLFRTAALNAAAFAAVLGIAIVGYYYVPHLLPKADIRLAAPTACQVAQAPCAIPLPDGQMLHLTLSPRPVPVVHPIAIELRAPAATRRVWADFAGVGMNMGQNRPELTLGNDNVWRAQATLPVCISGSMQWELTLIVESPGRRLHVPMRFDTHRQPEPPPKENA